MRTVLVIGLTAVLTAVGVAGAFVYGGGAGGRAAEEEAIEVAVEAAATGDLAEIVTAPGEVRPQTKVLISARVSARIAAIPVVEGQAVTRGGTGPGGEEVPPTLLVRLDATELESGLQSAEARRRSQVVSMEVERRRIAAQRAELDAARAELGFLERDLGRKQRQRERSAVSEADLDQAEYRVAERRARIVAAEHGLAAAEKNIEALEHNLAVADADIAKAREELSYARITAPIDGVVTKIHTTVGELTVMGTMNNPGTVILEVADLSRMMLFVQVDEADIGEVQLGQACEARVQAYPDRTFAGTVAAVALVASGEAEKVFQVEVLLDTGGERIYSGLTADVDIVTRRHAGVLRVPSQAVLGRPGDDLPAAIREGNALIDRRATITPVVYRLLDGKAVVTPVKLGPSDATHTVIAAGLAAGERVIVGPYKALEGLRHDQRAVDEKDKAAEKDKDTDKDKAQQPAAAEPGQAKAKAKAGAAASGTTGDG